MKNQTARLERKKQGNGGAFFGGTLFGILLGLLLVAGLFAFVYFKVSPQWVNKNFHTSIDLGNDTTNQLTLSKIVKNLNNMAKNTDTYTFNDLEKDFGVGLPASVKGIDISELYDKPIANIGEEVSTYCSNLSLNDLKKFEIVDLTSIVDLLDSQTKTYYYVAGEGEAQGRLYEDEAHNNEVTFDFELTDAVTGPVELSLLDIPLADAIAHYTNNIGDTKISELEDMGLVLPSVLDSIDKTKTINELGTEIDNLYLADFLGYSFENKADIQNSVIRDESNNIVTGVMARFARLQVKELNTAETVLKGMTIAEVLDYTIDGGVVKDNGVAVGGIMGEVAKLKVDELKDESKIKNIVNNLKLTDVFTDTSTGVFSLLDANITISEIPSKIVEAIQTKTIGDLVNAHVITIENYDPNKTLFNDPTGQKISELTIVDILNALFGASA